jgi:hypothetical protein
MPWNLIIAVVMLIASYAIQALTAQRPKTEKPKAITDFEFPQTAEGTPQAVIFGDCWSPDHQILWYGNYNVEPIRTGGGGGKK